MADAEDHTDPKIILIGLNKTATRSFHEMFLASGIPSVHWRDERERHIAPAMMSNIALRRPPLDGFGSARAFSDLTYITKRFVMEGAIFFRELRAAYPNAYFILNSRPCDDWLNSRAAHAGGTMLNRTIEATGLGRTGVIEGWRRFHHQHHKNVRSHFKDYERFIEYRIDRDDPVQIRSFLAPDFDVETKHWGRFNQRAQNSGLVA